MADSRSFSDIEVCDFSRMIDQLDTALAALPTDFAASERDDCICLTTTLPTLTAYAAAGIGRACRTLAPAALADAAARFFVLFDAAAGPAGQAEAFGFFCLALDAIVADSGPGTAAAQIADLVYLVGALRDRDHNWGQSRGRPFEEALENHKHNNNIRDGGSIIVQFAREFAGASAQPTGPSEIPQIARKLRALLATVARINKEQKRYHVDVSPSLDTIRKQLFEVVRYLLAAWIPDPTALFSLTPPPPRKSKSKRK